MRWTLGEGGFVYLDFSNARLDDQGKASPVLTSHAVYLVGDSSAVGTWLDDRPRRVSLDAVFTDSSVVTTWTADEEKGRTEYTVRSPAVVVVRDYVSVKGAERLFAEATYHREAGAPKD